MSPVDILIPLFVSIIGAFAASYFSFRYYAPRLRAELQKEYEIRFNERKWAAYEQFSDILYDVLDEVGTSKHDKKMPKVIKRLRKFLSQLWIVGSDDVVKAVSDWFMYSNRVADEEDTSAEGLFKLMTILIEMRKDLGYSGSEIEPVDLLRTFVTDIDDHIPQD